MKNLIDCTIASVIFCPDGENDLKEWNLKWDLEDKNVDELLNEIADPNN